MVGRVRSPAAMRVKRAFRYVEGSILSATAGNYLYLCWRHVYTFHHSVLHPRYPYICGILVPVVFSYLRVALSRPPNLAGLILNAVTYAVRNEDLCEISEGGNHSSNSL